MSKGDLYFYKGGLYTMRQLRNKFGIKESTFYHRLKRGMTVAEAIDTPTYRGSEDYKKIKCKPETGLPEDWLSLPLEEIKARALRNLEY